MPDEQRPETPDELALRAATSRPLGWAQVFDWDDCDCPKSGLHQPGCIYYGWEG